MRIGIAGITGRMGRLLVQEVAAAGATLVGGLCRSGNNPDNVTIFGDIEALAAAADLVIDFTQASAVIPHARALGRAGTAWVLGTTGLGTAEAAALDSASAMIPLLAAPNFSPGVNLLLALARRMGAALPAPGYDAEILEMHHRQKIDAPSGTALALGRAVAAGRGVGLEEVMVSGRHGDTGPRGAEEIGFATLRGGQIAGSHSLSFTAASEQILLTHHAFDRRVFAAGAVRAAIWLAGRPAGRYAMQDVLGF